uniref:CalQ n=1 Tax=uncultured Candidatus Entotheonella sp. TaxID=312019 RepID=A0A068PCD5_9BACT|nr:CalQ [uncultured Candidatus Entotheonella sp.]
MFPTQVGELSIVWLNQTLTDQENRQGARVVDFSTEPLADQGRTSAVYLLTLTYDQLTEMPTKLVLKFAMDQDFVKDALQDQNVFEREVTFYRRFGDGAGIPVPRCYAAAYDAEKNACVLLLEYIENAHQPDLFHGSVAEVDIAVEHLAPFHARWWQRQEELAGIPCEYDRPDQHVQNVTRALEKIPEEHRDDVGRTVIEVLELWLKHRSQIVVHCARGPLTLCHGSFHRQQLLCPTAENDPFRVIDWQSATIDCGPIDLARLLVTGLLPAARRAHETRLVERYHALLVENGVADYPLEQVWQHYRLGIVRVLVLHIQVFAHFNVKLMLEHWGRVAEEQSLWKVLFQWPEQALMEHAVPELLRQIARETPTIEAEEQG